MHILIKQFILSCYSDGTIRITPRALTHRAVNGQFTGEPRKVATPKVATGVCPVCGTVLKVEAA